MHDQNPSDRCGLGRQNVPVNGTVEREVFWRTFPRIEVSTIRVTNFKEVADNWETDMLKESLDSSSNSRHFLVV